jgi:hypothetical protein
MSKKLVTKDAKLVSEVENVLKKNNVPCVRVQLYKKEHGDMVKSDELLLAVTNKNGAAMRNAIESTKTSSKYYFGVLRNHPEYSIPRGIMLELAQESKKNAV